MKLLQQSVLTIIGAFIGYVFFIYLPILYSTEQECLGYGYPSVRVPMINLEKYCTNAYEAVPLSSLQK